jgi:hypothetical protein
LKILVDTSIWIDHLRSSDPALVELLSAGDVLAHPAVLGELACGTLRERSAVLTALRLLPAAPSATLDELLAFLERHSLWGKGLGWVDVHLLAAAALAQARLWTRDLRLRRAAASLGLAWAGKRSLR